MILFDTNILLAHFKGEEAVTKHITEKQLTGEVLCVSSISRTEMLALERMDENEVQEVMRFLTLYTSILFDDRLANEAGYIRREYGLKFQDAGIAATASVFGIPLLTRDKQMKKVKEVVVIHV